MIVVVAAAFFLAVAISSSTLNRIDTMTNAMALVENGNLNVPAGKDFVTNKAPFRDYEKNGVTLSDVHRQLLETIEKQKASANS